MGVKREKVCPVFRILSVPFSPKEDVPVSPEKGFREFRSLKFLFRRFVVFGRVLLGRKSFCFQEPGPTSFLETEGLPLDVDRRRMMEQTVQNRRGQGLIPKDLPPVQKTLVRRNRSGIQ